MAKVFNVNGSCDPELHYMVDLTGRLCEIKEMVDDGKYFTINRARQYGKTTTLTALAPFLKKEYTVLSFDFQTMSYDDFASEQNFTAAFARELLDYSEEIPSEARSEIQNIADENSRGVTLSVLFRALVEMCRKSMKKIVLIIDEVDYASNNQVFIDFLAQLRAYYLKRRRIPTFQSVILAGVYDIKNIKRKLHSDRDNRENSPWNIAADFLVDMSFSPQDIAGMLEDYEADYHTGMNVEEMSKLLYDYTSGYPYLVSRLCKFMDERIPDGSEYPDKASAWTKSGFLAAVKILLYEKNTLFESLAGKLEDYPELKSVLYELLFTGKSIPYTALNKYIEVAAMFGFIKNVDGCAVISNRIFESVLYNLFMSEEYINNKMYNAGQQEKNQFITGGHLNVRKILEKFVETFDYLYGNQTEAFLEDVGRRYFMLFLKPIINGVGNSYVEAETRNQERMDLVIDYRGEQYIIEMKVWRGNAYNERGEAQLCGYLDHFHINKGYMLSFNFNKKKKIGVQDIVIGDKLIVEAVV